MNEPARKPDLPFKHLKARFCAAPVALERPGSPSFLPRSVGFGAREMKYSEVKSTCALSEDQSSVPSSDTGSFANVSECSSEVVLSLPKAVNL